MKKVVLFIVFAFLPVLLHGTTQRELAKVLRLSVNSSINPATFNYLSSGFKKAQDERFDLVLITLNTPGGMVSTTKKIITLFGQSDIPVAIWINPEGASATSAGAIIASAAHFLYMSEGTNMGAATPITMNKDIQQKDMKNKAVNDLVSLIQGLAETRGRNGKPFAEMVKNAASFKAKEALKKNMIDGIVDNERELMTKIPDQVIHIKGKKVKMSGTRPLVVLYEMDLGQKLLDIFAHPNMSYILLLIGAALLYLELQAPGGFLAGSAGIISLMLAGIGFQLLPLNFGALCLILFSFVLLILEVYITSYGILALLGLGSLITGSLFLYRTDDVYLQLSSKLIVSAVSAIVFSLTLILWFVLKDRQKGKRPVFNSLKGRQAVIVQILEDGNYMAKISGELWQGHSERKLEKGDKCLVKSEDRDQMILKL